MKKDFTRDYATAAFRMWARQGCPTYNEAVAKIKKRALARAGNVEPLKALAFAEAEVDNRSAELCDIMACEETFAVLDRNRKYISNAVREVYMVDPAHEPRRGDISARVSYYARKIYASEAQVYRWLRHARELFCAFRGLRIDFDAE